MNLTSFFAAPGTADISRPGRVRYVRLRQCEITVGRRRFQIEPLRALHKTAGRDFFPGAHVSGLAVGPNQRCRNRRAAREGGKGAANGASIRRNIDRYGYVAEALHEDEVACARAGAGNCVCEQEQSAQTTQRKFFHNDYPAQASHRSRCDHQILRLKERKNGVKVSHQNSEKGSLTPFSRLK